MDSPKIHLEHNKFSQKKHVFTKKNFSPDNVFLSIQEFGTDCLGLVSFFSQVSELPSNLVSKIPSFQNFSDFFSL